ncbi:MAG: glutaredoxin family protein [Gallionella sp.]
MSQSRAIAKLYGNPFCHLCSEAEAILRRAGFNAIKIDVTENQDLFAKYSLRIPVLQRVDNNAELAWPFDAFAVSRFLR